MTIQLQLQLPIITIMISRTAILVVVITITQAAVTRRTKYIVVILLYFIFSEIWKDLSYLTVTTKNLRSG